MEYTFIDILRLIGAMGFFIYGMKVMSEGVQKIAGNQMRRVLNAMTINRFTSIFSGLVTTVLVQASSATTVMVVSFANAGLIKLRQAIAVVMGANIGTTLKALLWATFGFSKISLGDYSLVLVAVALPFMFLKKSKYKSWAEFIIGFALIFMGLDWIKNTVPAFSPEVLGFLKSMSGYGILSTIFFIVIGILVTAAIQSSSAAFALTMVLCNQGVIDFEAAAAIALGENIGTTITANIAALVANIHGKRAALSHTLFNVFGTLWMAPLLPLFLRGIEYMMVAAGQPSPFTDLRSIDWALAIFFISFDVINTFIVVWLIDPFEKLLVKLIPSRGRKEEFSLEYLVSGFMKTPELALLEAYKEVSKLGKTTSKMSEFTTRLLEENDRNKQNILFEKVKHYETLTDQAEEEIAQYLSKLSEDEISHESAVKVRTLLSVINDLERIGDIYVQMTKVYERKAENKIYFLPEQREALKSLFRLVDQSFQVMLINLEKETGKIDLTAAREAETLINQKRNELRQLHLRSIENGDFNVKSAMIFSELYTAAERVGDHVRKVSEALAEAA